MAAKKPHERVMEFVERELTKNPDLASKELFEKAKKISRSISGLSIRQFHAKYPLVVKRRLAAKTKSRRGSKGSSKRSRSSATKRTRRAPATRARKSAQPDRDVIRGVMLGFAKDLSAAGSQTETLDVISNLEKYIDKIAAA